MSGPVTAADATSDSHEDVPVACEVEVLQGRSTEVGGFPVRRLLPRRPRRTVGAWCFVDHMGPGDGALDIGPHPHIGLQTVTWLLDGAVLHRDSLGSEQVIRPGQLNLMTAGRGVAHAEETTGTYTGRLEGVQLWVAQPHRTRDGEPAFEHHAELPRVDLDGAEATVLVGDFGAERSPARRDTEHLGVDLVVQRGRVVVPLRRDFEHGLAVLRGSVRIGDHVLDAGGLGYLGTDRDEVEVESAERARVLLLGGTPFPEPLVMWWNYVARTRDEISAAHAAWSQQDPRFGSVNTSTPRIEVQGPSWRDP